MTITMKFKIGGALICLFCLILFGFFVWGIAAQSYWAIAVPMIIFVTAALGVGFTVGRLMSTTEVEEKQKSSNTPSSN